MKIALGIILILIAVYIACLLVEDGDFKETSSLFLLAILTILLISGMLALLYLGVGLIFGGLW